MSVMKPEPLDMTIEQMSEKSLELARKKIDRRLAEIKKENEEKEKKKAEYRVAHPEPNYKEDPERCWYLVKRAVEDGGVVDKNTLPDIRKKGSVIIPPDNGDVYPCPECGHMALYVDRCRIMDDPAVIYGGRINHIVCCYDCGFKPDVEHAYDEKDAWNTFKKWLKSNGYLKGVISI